MVARSSGKGPTRAPHPARLSCLGSPRTPGPKTQLPTWHGEFLPYADQFHADWTGFYGNRPQLKRAIRASEALLRATDIALSSSLVLAGAATTDDAPDL